MAGIKGAPLKRVGSGKLREVLIRLFKKRFGGGETSPMSILLAKVKRILLTDYKIKATEMEIVKALLRDNLIFVLGSSDIDSSYAVMLGLVWVGKRKKKLEFICRPKDTWVDGGSEFD